MKLREKVSAVAIASVVVVGMTFSSFLHKHNAFLNLLTIKKPQKEVS